MRVHTSTNSRWVLIGIAIRMAQSLGLHRDGSTLNLTPFESEMRLRLWWVLCLLDSRASEDHGYKPSALSHPALRYPLNVNDVDIHPDQTEPPQESDSWTDMTFFLTQLQTISLLRKVLIVGQLKQRDHNEIPEEIQRKREEIDKHGVWFMATFFRGRDLTKPVVSTALSLHRMACSKMHLILQIQEQEYQQRAWKQQHRRIQDFDDDVPFKAACDVLETSYQLQNNTVPAEHGWIFKIYTQWYALAYVLRGMCIRPKRSGIDRAWDIVNRVFGRSARETGDLQSSKATNCSAVTNAAANSQSNIVIGNGSIWGLLYHLRDTAISRASKRTEVPTSNRTTASNNVHDKGVRAGTTELQELGSSEAHRSCNTKSRASEQNTSHRRVAALPIHHSSAVSHTPARQPSTSFYNPWTPQQRNLSTVSRIFSASTRCVFQSLLTRPRPPLSVTMSPPCRQNRSP